MPFLRNESYFSFIFFVVVIAVVIVTMNFEFGVNGNLPYIPVCNRIYENRISNKYKALDLPYAHNRVESRWEFSISDTLLNSRNVRPCTALQFLAILPIDLFF